MCISDWSSDVCSSDLDDGGQQLQRVEHPERHEEIFRRALERVGIEHLVVLDGREDIEDDDPGKQKTTGTAVLRQVRLPHETMANRMLPLVPVALGKEEKNQAQSSLRPSPRTQKGRGFE